MENEIIEIKQAEMLAGITRGKETWMDNSKTGKKCQHAICYTGLYECP